MKIWTSWDCLIDWSKLRKAVEACSSMKCWPEPYKPTLSPSSFLILSTGQSHVKLICLVYQLYWPEPYKTILKDFENASPS